LSDYISPEMRRLIEEALSVKRRVIPLGRLSPELPRRWNNRYIQKKQEEKVKRQAKIVELTKKGLSPRQISDQLMKSESTIKNDIQRLRLQGFLQREETP
jgi:DNA-binding NarL/FixJ family response regulator